MDGEEEDLRGRFARLRTDEAAGAPAFAEVLHQPARGSARRWTRRRVILLALEAAAVVLMVIGVGHLLRPRRPAGALAYPVDLASTTWHGPTDYLLKLPDDPILRTVPRIGETELNWRIE